MTDSTRALKPALTFLQQHIPFCRMLPAHQEYLAMHLEQVFYAENDAIILPQDGAVESLYILKNGCVSGETDGFADGVKILNTGQCFPINALLNQRAVNSPYRAVKTVICYRLTQSNFEYLMQQSLIFHDFISGEKI